MDGTSHPNHYEFQLYESIIKGALRPHLPDNNDAVRIADLYRQEVCRMLLDSPEGVPHTKLILENPYFIRFKKLLMMDGDEFEIEAHDDGKVVLRLPHNIDNLIDLDIPEPTNVISAYYLFEIEKEYHRLQEKFMQLSTDPSLSGSDLKNYCNRNLQLLKVIAARAHTYSKQLEDAGYTDQLKHTPSYVIWVLKEYIIRTILLLQEIFEPYLRVKPLSWEQLEVKYYEHVQRMARIENKMQSLRKKKNSPHQEQQVPQGGQDTLSNPTLVWLQLFKGNTLKEQKAKARKILGILRDEGYITEDGTWQESPFQLTMIALYLTLKDRGYLVATRYSAATLSDAFNIQFNMKFNSDKQWEPQRRQKAEDYKQKFNAIPVHVQ